MEGRQGLRLRDLLASHHRRALDRLAERVRKLLREAEDQKAMRPAASAPEAEDSEAPAVSRRMDRRVRGAGRLTISSR